MIRSKLNLMNTVQLINILSSLIQIAYDFSSVSINHIDKKHIFSNDNFLLIYENVKSSNRFLLF